MSPETIAEKLTITYNGKETEQNWEKVDSLLRELTEEIPKSSNDELLSAIKRCKQVIQDLVKITKLLTERTRLALTLLTTLQAIVKKLLGQYESLQEYFFHPIIKLCERTSKILSEKAKATLLDILKCCPLPLKIIMNKLVDCKSSPNKNLRQCIIDFTIAIMKSLPIEALIEYEGSISNIIKGGLEDAAESVRASSRLLFFDFATLFPMESKNLALKLPLSVLKALNLKSSTGGGGGGQSTSTSNSGGCSDGGTSFKPFIANKSFNGHELTKTTGPQRIAAKPTTTFHPYSNDQQPLKKSIKLENGRVALRMPTKSTAIPTFSPYITSFTPTTGAFNDTGISSFAASTISVLPQPQSQFQPQVPVGIVPEAALKFQRMYSSSSIDNPSFYKSKSKVLEPLNAIEAVSNGNNFPMKSSSLAPLRENGDETTTTTPPIISRTLSAKDHVIEFITGVKSSEWDSRYKALCKFTKVMECPNVIDYIITSKSTTSRMFDIFLGGLMDVHFKVVCGVLEYGKKLLMMVKVEKCPDPANFATMAILRLFAASTNVQFKAKQNIIDDANFLVNEIGGWLKDQNLYLEVLVGATLRQDAAIFTKARLGIVSRFLDILKSSLEPSEESTRVLTNILRKLGTLLTVKDEGLCELISSCLLLANQKFSIQDVHNFVPFECKELLLVETFIKDKAITSTSTSAGNSGASLPTNRSKLLSPKRSDSQVKISSLPNHQSDSSTINQIHHHHQPIVAKEEKQQVSLSPCHDQENLMKAIDKEIFLNPAIKVKVLKKTTTTTTATMIKTVTMSMSPAMVEEGERSKVIVDFGTPRSAINNERVMEEGEITSDDEKDLIVNDDKAAEAFNDNTIIDDGTINVNDDDHPPLPFTTTCIEAIQSLDLK